MIYRIALTSLALVLATTLLDAQPVLATKSLGGQSVDQRRTISVTGEATMQLEPNMAEVRIGVVSEGKDVRAIKADNDKRLRAIARDINDLAARARSKQLSADDISGGTFTLSNSGSFGSHLVLPIINQPQVAIISTDGVHRKPVVVNGADGSESIAIHSVGMLAMSWDHRAFDGAYAAAFLRDVKEIIETRDWEAEL
jgi:2-oxoglutarate dehydrogenase E2 component (dihydrolipoamide succinyltransferase)